MQSFHHPSTAVGGNGANPDLLFTSNAILLAWARNESLSRYHIPSTDITAAVESQQVPFRRRFNFRKANWDAFRSELDSATQNIKPIVANYDVFVETLRKVSRWWIPRGCRQQHIPGLSTNSKTLYDTYTKLYEEDPFFEETITAGETLVSVIAKERRKAWQDMINSIDMTHNSKKSLGYY